MEPTQDVSKFVDALPRPMTKPKVSRLTHITFLGSEIKCSSNEVWLLLMQNDTQQGTSEHQCDTVICNKE